ncbi:MAG: HlyD family efflux transporter periplasmic adaptor subunit [Candidatus Gracilibacteria bacterium]|nr:HlyD family efflux transporter periplasmic adaptor subunit [Candidatus Gracilibacteria bacterium]
MSLAQEIKNNSKQTTTRKIIFFIFFLLIGYFFYQYFFSNTNKSADIAKELKTYSVKNGDLKTYIEGDGKVFIENEINLDFIEQGIIDKIYKKEGDYVKKGDLIAILSSDYFDIAVDKAELALRTAKANYEIKNRGGTISEVNISQRQLDSSIVGLDSTKSQAQIDLKNAQLDYSGQDISLKNIESQAKIDELTSESLVKNAQIDLDNKKNDLELTTTQEKEKYKNIQDSLIMEIGQLITQIEKNLFQLDLLLGVSKENKDQNDNYEKYLSAKNTNIKSLAIENYTLAKKDFDTFYSTWKENRQNLDYDKLNTYAQSLKEVAGLTNKSLNYTIESLKYSVESTPYFTQDIINNYISDFEKYLEDLKDDNASFSQKIMDLQEAKTSMDYKIKSLENEVVTYEQKYELAKNNLEKTILKNKSDISLATQKLEQSKTNIDNVEIKNNLLISNNQAQVEISKSLLDGKTEVDQIDLEPYYLAILTAQKNLDEAIKKRQDIKIISPIDGKITNIEGKVGEATNSLKNAFVTIIGANEFVVEAYIEESDIVKIKNNQQVYISFDSIDGLNLTGTVLYVNDKGYIDTNGLVSYKTQILFNTDNKIIKDGMSVTLQFVTKEMNNVIIIPVEAVRSINKKPNILLETKEYKQVTTGFTDGKMVEIISGLNNGDKILY